MFKSFVKTYTGFMDVPVKTKARTNANDTRSAVGAARRRRRQALADARRQLVLEAARATFLELGMDKAGMREIAQRAGYTPGAIYSYFPSKEALYGALLDESLQRLDQRVQAACSGQATPAGRLRAAATAFFDFYRENPRDLDLGFYLFQGMQPRGLTPELDRALNRRLQATLQPVQDALQALDMPAPLALRETTALFAHVVGLLLLSHTGRIRMFRQAPGDLFADYLGQLLQRAGAAA